MAKRKPGRSTPRPVRSERVGLRMTPEMVATIETLRAREDACSVEAVSMNGMILRLVELGLAQWGAGGSGSPRGNAP